MRFTDRGQRLYNYPWVAQLHLEMYKAFPIPLRYLTDCFTTLRRLLPARVASASTPSAFPCSMPSRPSLLAGREEERGAASYAGISCVTATGVVSVRIAASAPRSELRANHCRPGGAPSRSNVTCSRCKCALPGTGARELLPALEAFNGVGSRTITCTRSPSATGTASGLAASACGVIPSPHYWSAADRVGLLPLLAGHRRGELPAARARNLLNNLSAFSAPTAAPVCVYIYPDAVNGNPARCWDPLANDQDWALVFLLAGGWGLRPGVCARLLGIILSL